MIKREKILVWILYDKIILKNCNTIFGNTMFYFVILIFLILLP